mmetsp:Transcript_15032/g.42726  ORF Transcript_15032/g.42726 Transcript_15032/m.42726 type:complete len:330 (-) Transcript_15032:323-1312(-)
MQGKPALLENLHRSHPAQPGPVHVHGSAQQEVTQGEPDGQHVQLGIRVVSQIAHPRPAPAGLKARVRLRSHEAPQEHAAKSKEGHDLHRVVGLDQRVGAETEHAAVRPVRCADGLSGSSEEHQIEDGSRDRGAVDAGPREAVPPQHVVQLLGEGSCLLGRCFADHRLLCGRNGVVIVHRLQHGVGHRLSSLSNGARQLETAENQHQQEDQNRVQKPAQLVVEILDPVHLQRLLPDEWMFQAVLRLVRTLLTAGNPRRWGLLRAGRHRPALRAGRCRPSPVVWGPRARPVRLGRGGCGRAAAAAAAAVLAAAAGAGAGALLGADGAGAHA